MADSYPKWVIPDATHIVNQGGHVSTPTFDAAHQPRGGSDVFVLVKSSSEEKASQLPRKT